MASIPLHFSATIVDGLGTEASTLSYLTVPDSATLAQINVALGTWLSELDAVTDGAIVKTAIRITPGFATIVFPTALKAATGTAWLNSRVEQTGVLNFGNTVSNHRFGQVIPAIADSKLLAGKINLSDAAVALLLTLLSSGTPAGGNYTNNAQQVLSALIDAILAFRKRRKQLSRTSFEV